MEGLSILLVSLLSLYHLNKSLGFSLFGIPLSTYTNDSYRIITKTKSQTNQLQSVLFKQYFTYSISSSPFLSTAVVTGYSELTCDGMTFYSLPTEGHPESKSV